MGETVINQKNDDGLGGWDSWDVPSSVVSDGGGRTSLSPQQSMLQQQINQYRLNQQRKLQEPVAEPEPEPNYFEVSLEFNCKLLFLNIIYTFFLLGAIMAPNRHTSGAESDKKRYKHLSLRVNEESRGIRQKIACSRNEVSLQLKKNEVSLTEYCPTFLIFCIYTCTNISICNICWTALWRMTCVTVMVLCRKTSPTFNFLGHPSSVDCICFCKPIWLLCVDQSAELEEWMDDNGGWEDEAEEEADLDAVLREKRQFERERRRQEQQRRKAEKEAARCTKLSASKIATKLS
nr:uncharacterized protein LOC128685194 [Cherax quadricarinatus]